MESLSERRRFTTREVLRMVDTGILSEDEPLELINGELVVMTPQGPLHAMLIAELNARLAEVYAAGAHVRVQLPIDVSPHSLPEPDLAVVRGMPRDYRDRHPGGADVLLVVEIADQNQSAARAKIATYASAAIPAYWLLDVPSRRLEVHLEPTGERYGVVKVLEVEADVALPGADQRWTVASLLP